MERAYTGIVSLHHIHLKFLTMKRREFLVGSDSINIGPKKRKNHFNHNKYLRDRADNGHAFFTHTSSRNSHFTERDSMIRWYVYQIIILTLYVRAGLNF